MFTRRAAYIAWLLAAPALLPAVDHADDANNAKVAESAADTADADLLEYLGSVDAEGPEWMEYLTHTESAQIAKAKRSPGTSEEQEK
jgi:hypothetical protein